MSDREAEIRDRVRATVAAGMEHVRVRRSWVVEHLDAIQGGMPESEQRRLGILSPECRAEVMALFRTPAAPAALMQAAMQIIGGSGVEVLSAFTPEGMEEGGEALIWAVRREPAPIAMAPSLMETVIFDLATGSISIETPADALARYGLSAKDVVADPAIGSPRLKD